MLSLRKQTQLRFVYPLWALSTCYMFSFHSRNSLKREDLKLQLCSRHSTPQPGRRVFWVIIAFENANYSLVTHQQARFCFARGAWYLDIIRMCVGSHLLYIHHHFHLWMMLKKGTDIEVLRKWRHIHFSRTYLTCRWKQSKLQYISVSHVHDYCSLGAKPLTVWVIAVSAQITSIWVVIG